MRFLYIFITSFLWILFFPSNAQTINEIKRFQLDEARQGVAVDANYFYVINNSSITKHEKSTGKQLARWDGSNLGVKHLNSGAIIDGKLYCANSNYPESPMASSIEIFDPVTLTHIDSHSLGIDIGSATWIDQKDGFWYVGFAHYSGKNSSENKDNRWTQLVKFDREWRRVGGWIFPKNLIEAFMSMSNSGGAWVGDELYVTGHDNFEVYVLRLPKIGYTLEYVKTIPVSSFGQGIALDDSELDRLFLYGIIKSKNEVVVSEIK